MTGTTERGVVRLRGAASLLGLVVAGLAFGMLASPASGAVSFSRTDHAVGNDPSSIASGQLTQGIAPDLAVAAGFQAAPLIGVGSGAFVGGDAADTDDILVDSVALGDLNDDGADDLAFSGATGPLSTSNFGAALGNGDGTFDPPFLVPPDTSFAVTVSIQIADLDGDTNPDLAAVDPDAGLVTTARGNGDGTFATAADITAVESAGDLPNAVTVGDLDGDGDQDLVVAIASATAASNGVAVLEGNGDGTFAAPAYFGSGNGSAPGSVAIADFNGDGDPDLATANTFGPNAGVAILDGRGDGTFGAPRILAAGIEREFVAVGDLNADGELDLATADGGANSASFFAGNGDGSFDPPSSFAVGNDPQKLAIADFDGDDRPDLATANAGSDSVSVLLNTSEPTADRSDTSLAFGSRRVGTTSAAQTLTVTNRGDARLHVESAEVVGGAGDDFLVAGDGCSGATLTVGDDCEVRLRFSPQAAGARSATLRLTDDAPDSPQDVALGGTGLAGPTASPSPGSLSFGSRPSGTTTAPQTVTLTNGGDDDLHVSSAFVTGTNAASFELSGNTCDGATVAPGNSCQVDVAFAATGDGARSASLRFAADAAGSPQSVSLSGTAVAGGGGGGGGGGVATPTISTQASADVELGGQVTDSATLAGGQSPGGQITFRLYGPDDPACAAAPVFTGAVPVSGNGTYASSPFTPEEAGTYRWIASYSGDANNDPATGSCGDAFEEVTVSSPPPPPGTPEVEDLRLTRDAFVAGKKRTPLRRTGTAIRFDLSEDATVYFRVRRDKPNGTGGPPPRHSHRFTRELEAGAQSVAFTGRLDGRTFRPGRYLMFVWAVDASGLDSEPQSIPFRILRR